MRAFAFAGVGILTSLLAFIGAAALFASILVVQYIPGSGLATLLSASCAVPGKDDRWLKVMVTRTVGGEYHVLCWQMEFQTPASPAPQPQQKVDVRACSLRSAPCRELVLRAMADGKEVTAR